MLKLLADGDYEIQVSEMYSWGTEHSNLWWVSRLPQRVQRTRHILFWDIITEDYVDGTFREVRQWLKYNGGYFMLDALQAWYPQSFFADVVKDTYQVRLDLLRTRFSDPAMGKSYYRGIPFKMRLWRCVIRLRRLLSGKRVRRITWYDDQRLGNYDGGFPWR